MSLKIKLEKKIKDKQTEIIALEVALKEAQAYLQATQDALRLLTKSDYEEDSENSNNTLRLRPGSILHQAFEILKQHGKPMNGMDILAALGKEQNYQNRQSIIASISGYARRGNTFTRTGKNTFGLAMWKNKKYEKNEPPEDFGLVS